MPHVDEGTLHALLDGALRAESPAEADRVEAHLRECEDCRARYDGAVGTRDAAAAILADLDVDVTPDFDEVVRRSAAGAGATGPTGSSRLARQARWTRRAAWAASLVVALGTGYLVGERFGAPGSEAVRSQAPERAETRALDAGSGPDLDRQTSPAPNAVGAAEAAGAARGDEPAPDPEPAGRLRREPPPTQARARASGEDPAQERAPARVARTAEEGEAVAEADVDAAGTEPSAGVPAARVARAETAGTGEAVAREVLAGEETALKSAADEAPRPLALQDTARRLQAFADEAISLNALTVTGEPSDTVWRPVDLATARRAVADSLYVLPRAEAREAFISPDGRSVRTLQRLSSGVVVDVVQRRSGSAVQETAEPEIAGARPRAAEPAAPPQPQPAEVEDTTGAEPGTVARAEVGGFVLEVTGPIPTDLLQILASAARPLPH